MTARDVHYQNRTGPPNGRHDPTKAHATEPCVERASFRPSSAPQRTGVTSPVQTVYATDPDRDLCGGGHIRPWRVQATSSDASSARLETRKEQNGGMLPRAYRCTPYHGRRQAVQHEKHLLGGTIAQIASESPQDPRHSYRSPRGGVSAQRARSAQQQVSSPVTTLKTTHHRGSYVHRAKTADLDSNLALFMGEIVCVNHYLSLWTE